MKHTLLGLIFCGWMFLPVICDAKVKTEVSPSYDHQSIKKIAVFPFGNDAIGFAPALSDALATEFVAMGYDVLERTRLAAILAEMKLNASGAIDTATGIDLGKLANVDAVVFGSVSSNLAGEIYALNFRMVNIRTGETEIAVSYFNSSGKKPFSAINDVVESIGKKVFSKQSGNRNGTILAVNETFQRTKIGKVAIMPLLGPSYFGESDAVYGALATELIGAGVAVVERKDMNRILEEQYKHTSGLYEQSDESKTPREIDISKSTQAASQLVLSEKLLKMVGGLTGAKAVLVGSYSLTYRNSPIDINLANLRLIDVETARIIWGVTYYKGNSFTTDTSMPGVIEVMIAALAPGMKTVTPLEYRNERHATYKRLGTTEMLIGDKITDYSQYSYFRD